MAVMLTQWLCSQRHAAYAIPWDDTTTTAAATVAAGEELRAGLGLADHCGICGGSIAPEHARTRFTSLAEAMPALTEMASAQLESRRALDDLGLTVEKLP